METPEKHAQKTSPVIAIIVIIAIVGLGLYFFYGTPDCFSDRTLRARGRAHIEFLQAALEDSYRVTGECPSLEGMNEASDHARGSTDLKDPWGSEYVVRCNTQQGVVVFSKGPDGRTYTEDDVR